MKNVTGSIPTGTAVKQFHLKINYTGKRQNADPRSVDYLRGPGPWTTLVDHFYGPFSWTTRFCRFPIIQVTQFSSVILSIDNCKTNLSYDELMTSQHHNHLPELCLENKNIRT